MTSLEHEIPGGQAWSVVVRAGRQITFTASAGGANVSLLMFAADGVDRLNVPDTLKAQLSARITPPMVLMSDRGTALASVTGSSLGWHDALCGHSTDAHVPPGTSYQTDRNDWRRSARHGLLAELAKRGLGPADLHGCVNLFSKVVPAEDGRLQWVTAHSREGDWVTLRSEQELLLVCSTAPHPLDPDWAPAAVLVTVEPAPPYGEDDPSVTFRDESARALRVVVRA